jgi:hypothetical protein
MQRGSLSRQSSYENRHGSGSESLSDDEEDIQAQAAENRNDSPTAALPVPVVGEDQDLERGIERSRSRSPRYQSWRDWRRSWTDWVGENVFGNGNLPDRNR